MLTDAQIERYSRQLILPEVGGRGQERLLAATVAVQGRGHLATTTVLYLAAAGVGCLRLEAAMTRVVSDLNPDCRLEVVEPSRLWGGATALAIAAGVAVSDAGGVIEATRRGHLPLIIACSDVGVVLHCDGSGIPCAACTAAALTAEAGPPVATPTAPHDGVLGAHAATEAIKRLLGLEGGGPRLTSYRADDVEFAERPLVPRVDCRVCERRISGRARREGTVVVD